MAPRRKQAPGPEHRASASTQRSRAPRARKALVLGSSGLVGSLLLRLLLDDERYGRVTALVRRPLAISHPGLRQAVIDFDRMDRFEKEFDADDVFCCLGSTIKKAGSREAFSRVDLHYPLAAARIAKAKGARHFLIVTSMGANPASRVFYSRVKGEVESGLAGGGFRSLSILRPSLLLGKRDEKRTGESIMIALAPVFSPLLSGPLRKYRPIRAEDVAKAMIEIAAREAPGTAIYESDRLADIAAGR